MLIFSLLESGYLGVSLKVKMAWDFILEISSAQTWLFISEHLGCRMKDIMDDNCIVSGE